MATPQYGLTESRETAGLTGKQLLEAIIDGRLAQPPISEALSFRLVEVGDGFAAYLTTLGHVTFGGHHAQGPN